MSEETAAAAAEPAADADEWEHIATGLGKEWKGDEGAAPLVGYLVGAETVELKEPREDGSTQARAFIFADPETGEQLFVWSSHELDTALVNVNRGDKVRISFLGRDSFSGSDGPRQVKRYKVERAKVAG